MDPRFALYFLTAIAGLTMVVGGIWLIYKEKIYIDHESKQPIEISTPVGTFKSNYPALALFVLGFFPLAYPLHEINNLDLYVKVDRVRIKGPVDTDAYPVLVYVSRAQDSLTKKGEFQVPVPYLGRNEDDYKVLLVVNGRVIDEARPERQGSASEIAVKFRPVVVEPAAYEADLKPVPPGYQ